MKKIITTIAIALSLGANAQIKIINTAVGTGIGNYTGDGGQATAATLNSPNDAISDAAGNLYIADQSNHVIRKVTTAGIITTIAGSNALGGSYTGDGGQATDAGLNLPNSIAFDAAGNLYITDQNNNAIRMVNTAGIISTIAGNGTANYNGDGGAATAAQINSPSALAINAMGNLYFVDNNNAIRMINTAGIINTVAGNASSGYTGDGGIATAATFNYPQGLTFDMAGNLYVSDQGNSVIRLINTAGIVSTIAGNGSPGYSGDGAAATAAQLQNAAGVAIDAGGNLYLADYNNKVIRMVNTAGIISTVAGNGTYGYTGDGGVATAAELEGPQAVVFDPMGNLYIVEYDNSVVRKLTQSTFGAALNFDGTINDQISMGTAMTTAMGTFSVLTVEAWVKPATVSSGSESEIIGNYDSPNGNMQFLLRQQQNTYAFFADPGTGFQAVTSPAGTATANVWQHVAGVWDGNNLMIYINGVLQATQTGVTGPNLNNSITNAVVMGYEPAGSGEGFSGDMDEVRVWSCVRTQCQINTSMNCELAPSDRVNLFAYYKFNEGIAGANNPTVNILVDSSGNGYNGTLDAFALTGTSGNWVAPGGVTTGVSCGPVVNPTVTVNSATVCAGTTTTLTASGVTTYSWSTSATTASITPSPTVTASYTVTGANANYCMASAISTVSVNTLPTVSVTVNTATVCAGAKDTITANGTATSYTWNTNATTMSITPSPTVTSTYTVMGTDANNCMNWATATINVNALPTLSVTTSAGYSICPNTLDTLKASGTATSYTWNTTHAVTDYTVHPFNSTTYTLTGVDANGCKNTITQLITVYPRPTLTVTATSGTVCTGNSTTLSTITGSVTVTSYSWNTGATTPSISVSPVMTSTYSVQGFDAEGCSTTKHYTVTVNSLPTITATSNIDTICIGGTATLTAGGATTYTWNTSATSASIPVTLTVTTTYTVMGTDGNGCENMTTVTETVSTTCQAGIERYSADNNNVSVYPNPSNGNFIITTTENTSSIMVTDMLGNELQSINPTGTSTNINMSAQPSGVYFIKVTANGVQAVKRIIINN